MSRIARLSPLLANQIAAGEVIERPSSIVKEVLENALDAGASRIEIDIEEAGKSLIRIRDNGCGIEADDLALALTRHATSKIGTVDDLQAIESLGFRGEALASIAAVSKLKLISRTESGDTGYEVSVEGSDCEPSLAPCAHPIGTTVEVRQLFFNVPARRKFLRADQTEFNHIHEVVKQIAMSCHTVAFTLRHNGKRILQLPGGASPQKQRLRVSKVCGNAFVESAGFFNTLANHCELVGWVGAPEQARSYNDCQYFYVNGRLVKDKLVSHAVREAYSEFLYTGKYPAFVLFLTIPADKVDVNVHPTKHEVRFHESRWVHDFIYKNVYDVLCAPKDESEQVADTAQDWQQSTEVDDVYAKAESAVVVESEATHTDSKRPLFPERKDTEQNLTKLSGLLQSQPSKGMSAPSLESEVTIILLIENKYALIEYQNAYTLVDLVAWMQAWLAHSWQQAHAREGKLPSAPLLLPMSFSADESSVESDYWQDLGFTLEQVGPNQCRLREVPTVCARLDFSRLIDDIQLWFVKASKQTTDKVITTMAKVFAPSLVEKYSRAELAQCLEKGFETGLIAQHAITLTTDSLSRLFKS